MDNIIDIPASLHLSTGQISTDHTNTAISNTIGGWENGRQTFWFNQVNLRTVLGNYYEKYDKFIISVVHIYVGNSVANTGADAQYQLQIGGLGWVNSSYDQVSQANSYWTPVANFIQGIGAAGANLLNYDILSNSFVFSKNNPYPKIEFRYVNIITNKIADPPTSGLFPNASMIFKIQPVKE